MTTIIFDPLLPWWLVAVAGALGLLAAGLAAARGLSGWWLRGLAAIAVVAALSGPSLQTEERQPLTDIVLLADDVTASQRVSDREARTAEAVAVLEARLAERPNTEVRRVTVSDDPGDGGTALMAGIAEALAEEPRARVAGIVAVTDGQIHDPEAAPDLPAPFHVLTTGEEGDWDRKLSVLNAPSFAILGEEVVLTIRIDDEGEVPLDAQGLSEITIAVDGGPPTAYTVPTGEDLELPVILDHGGRNVIRFAVPGQEGELTERNNAALVQMNGVRDRLRVLLVSGEPHAGERTWRNLLKSDSQVDLVHFTILRPPEKQDGVPVDELSLIAFPTRELFMDKIDEFDLIIFDRYKRRGILPGIYLDNIRAYVEGGGAVLIAAGPDFAGADSIYRSPLGEAIPGYPTARVIEEGFVPQITDLGQRHPVTEGLDALAPGPATEEGPGWGRWFRVVEVEPTEGVTVMEGLDRPLLQLARAGEGRVALLASDQAWLWARGYEGGGPQLELLRRLAHWMMKEPELEEETLTATAVGREMTIVRRTLEEGVDDVTVTAPDGTEEVVALTEVSPGRWEGSYSGSEDGLYRLAEGARETVIGLGPAAPREFASVVATDEILLPVAEPTGGTVRSLEDGIPRLRDVREGRPASGRGWIGLLPREAFRATDLSVTPLLPAWAFLLLASLLLVGAWLREGRS